MSSRRRSRSCSRVSTPCAGARSPRTGTCSPASTPSASACPPPSAEAYGASGPTTAEHVVRWGYLAALALLVDGLGFRLLVLPGPLPARLERRFFVVTGIGAVGALEAGIVAFLLRAEGAIRVPFSEFLYSDLQPMAEGTRFGKAFVVMTLGFAVVASLLFLAC